MGSEAKKGLGPVTPLITTDPRRFVNLFGGNSLSCPVTPSGLSRAGPPVGRGAGVRPVLAGPVLHHQAEGAGQPLRDRLSEERKQLEPHRHAGQMVPIKHPASSDALLREKMRASCSPGY